LFCVQLDEEVPEDDEDKKASDSDGIEGDKMIKDKAKVRAKAKAKDAEMEKAGAAGKSKGAKAKAKK
jgi:hypothetical protein